MNQKRVLAFSIVFLLALLVVVPFVSAQGVQENIETGIKFVVDVLKPFFQIVIGDLDENANEDEVNIFLAKTLIMIIVFIIAFLTFNQIDFFAERGWVPGVLGLIVAIISVRWLGIGDGDVFEAIFLPYGILGISTTVIIPFALSFKFITGLGSSISRKVGWLVFSVIYLLFAIVRWDDLAKIALTEGDQVFNLAILYIVGFVIGLLMFFRFDDELKTIREKDKVKRLHAVHNRKEIERLTELKAQRITLFGGGGAYSSIFTGRTGDRAFHEDIKTIDDKIATLSKGL